MGRLRLLQIDSVNVVVRSHYLPVFSRLGAYERDLIDREAYGRRTLFEYWAHEASLVPVALHPLLRWRMARGEAWGRMARMAEDKPGYVQAVLDEVADRGPLAASELSEPGVRRGPWWGWGDGKATMEWLFWTGQVAGAERRNFERRYVPAAQRVHGYYVLPLLLGERLVGRVDLKADRRRGVLLVPGAFAEPGADRGELVGPLLGELVRLAGWLGLDDIEVGESGDLAR